SRSSRPASRLDADRTRLSRSREKASAAAAAADAVAAEVVAAGAERALPTAQLKQTSQPSTGSPFRLSPTGVTAGNSSRNPPGRSQIRDGREMLINVADADECRIAMLLSGRLDELYMERVSSVSHVGNIYKGRVTNVEPSIQAAFVDFGLTTQGFLHISDLHP